MHFTKMTLLLFAYDYCFGYKNFIRVNVFSRGILQFNHIIKRHMSLDKINAEGWGIVSEL